MEKQNKSLSEKFKDRKEQMKIHLEEFGKGKNRDIDTRERFVMTMILPIIEKDVAEAIRKEYTILLMLIRKTITIKEFWKYRDEILGEFEEE